MREREPCLCLDDPDGAIPEGECLCFERGDQCGCYHCGEVARLGEADRSGYGAVS